MSIVIKPTDEKSNFRSLATADYKWMVVASVDYRFTAFEDNTRLFVNGSLNTTLSKQTMSDISLSAGDIVSSDKSISFTSHGAGHAGKTGICYGWEGTLFGHRIDRYSPTIYITATRRDATVTITRQTSGTVVVSNASVAKDSLYSYTASDTDDQYIITSNYPIACYVDDKENLADARDSLPLFPPATDLFGTFSGGGHIIASQASTSYNGYGTGGTTISGTLSAIGSATESVIAGGNNFSGESTRVIADKPIFAESQADGDGGEQTPFVSKEAFGTQFVIPSDENEWVKLVSDVPANYEVFNTSGTSVGTGTLAGVDISGVEGGIYNAYLGSATAGSALTAQGNLIVTDQPVYAVYEADGDDETVLFAKAPVNNTSTHVNPKIVTDELLFTIDAGNSKSYPGSGTTWTDLSGNGNTGTLQNGPTYSSLNGGSIVFDGSNDYVSFVDNFGNPQQFSFEFWAYPTELNIDGNNNYRRIFVAAGASSNNVNTILLEQNGNISFRVPGGGTGNIQGSAYSSTNQWGHGVCTYDQSNKKIYFNGDLKTTSSEPGITVDFGSPQINYPSSQTFKGNISIVRIYSKALTALEIKQNFQALRSRFGI